MCKQSVYMGRVATYMYSRCGWLDAHDDNNMMMYCNYSAKEARNNT